MLVFSLLDAPLVTTSFCIDFQVSGSTERKICAVGITKLLCETPVMLANYSEQWPQLLTALVALFELPEDDNLPDDEHFIDIEDTPGYQTAYSQLVFAGKREDDPVKGKSNLNTIFKGTDGGQAGHETPSILTRILDE